MQTIDSRGGLLWGQLSGPAGNTCPPPGGTTLGSQQGMGDLCVCMGEEGSVCMFVRGRAGQLRGKLKV